MNEKVKTANECYFLLLDFESRGLPRYTVYRTPLKILINTRYSMVKMIKEFADIKQKPRLLKLFNASKSLGSAVPFLLFIAIVCGELGFHFIG